MGRFAPSPSGALHWGSLYTAAASYLDARAHGGRWLVRIEDLDVPRVEPGSAGTMLRTLRRFGFEWDGEIVYQSDRTERYVAALEALACQGLTFPCSCSRAQLADEDRYPGFCRTAPLRPGTATAIRLRVEPNFIEFTDRIQGRFRQDVSAAIGDLLLKRRDGLFAYVLAVVIDDAAQDVTHVLRGADLLDNTPRQIHLQRLLQLSIPSFAHLPVLTEPDGRKLAKSARSADVDGGSVSDKMLTLFRLLHLTPPPDLKGAPVAELWPWAIANWDIQSIPKRLTQNLPF